MPVYLPPISRRQFLKGSLAAAALGMAGCATTKTSRDPNSFALFSDIHIAADPAKVARNVNMTDHLRAATSEVLALPQLPGTVFVNGDIAFNSGEPGDYSSAIELLHPLRAAGMPIYLNLGNHDDREHFWAVFKEEKNVSANLPGRQATIVRTPLVNWFLLDSLIKTLTTPGKLGDAQLAWLAQALDANPSKPAMVMIHHQPGDLSAKHPGGGLEDAEALFAILRPRQQVKAYIFGHTHHWSARQEESGLYLINLPPVAYVFDEGQPSGWVHATIQDGGAQLRLHCLDHSHVDNGRIVNLAWRA